MTLVESIHVFVKAAREVQATWNNDGYDCLPWNCRDSGCKNFKRYVEAVKKVAGFED